MIDIQLARQHLKADDESIETELIEQYVDSAISICEGYCNRRFYETVQAKIQDYPLAITDLEDAISARDAALEATTKDEVKNAIVNDYIMKRGSVLARINGIVIDNTIIAAILFTLGNLYRNRQDVVAGQYAGATKLPIGAQRILEPYLWIGDLGGMPQ